MSIPISQLSSHANPYPSYAAYRQQVGFIWDSATSSWLVSQAALVEAVLHSQACGVRPAKEAIPSAIQGSAAGAIFGELVRMNEGCGHQAPKAALAQSLTSLCPREITAIMAAENLFCLSAPRDSAALRPLHNRSERPKFESRSAPVLEHSEHRRIKIRSHSSLCKGLYVLVALSFLLSQFAFAENTGGLPAITSTPASGGGQNYSLSIQTLLFLSSLAFIPAALLMMTSFTRIIIVLSLLRQALGTQSAPPNQVLIGLSLFLTLFVMGPALDKIYEDAYLPFSDNKITMQVAMEKGVAPLKTFMLKQTRESDIALYVKLSNTPALQGPEDVPLRVLIPAFITSELKTAFQIAFAIFIPFLIIDMVVASVLMAMGMMMVSPSIVSLPFKLMLFVLVDGWQLLIGSLARSFY